METWPPWHDAGDYTEYHTELDYAAETVSLASLSSRVVRHLAALLRRAALINRIQGIY